MRTLSRWAALAAAAFIALQFAPPAGARGSAPAAPVHEVALADLPREARDTLARVRRGGPFPYDRDGIVFDNREQLLPLKPRGYYREYTVPTPGLSHRGARRIVAGGCGASARGEPEKRLELPCATTELYYTDDHYRSFKRIRE